MSYVFKIQANSGFAIVKRSEPINQHNISNNIDSACAFRIAGTENSDLWFIQFFGVVRERKTERIGYKKF
jgi:hypothetical protein